MHNISTLNERILAITGHTTDINEALDEFENVKEAVGELFDANQALAILNRRLKLTLDYAKLPVYTLPLVMLILAVFALVLEPLHNFISRRYERQSDRYALQKTGNKQAYISSFSKLARLNKEDPHPHSLEVFLFHGHPPIAERLAAAENEGSK